MFKNISLKFSILQIFTTLLLITAAIISFNFYNKTSEALSKLSDQVTKEVTDKVIERVTNYLNAPAIQTKAISHLVNNPNIMEIHTEMWKYMWQQLMVMPHLQSIFLADTQGNYVQVRREPRLATRCIDRRIDPPVETWLFRNENYEVVERKIKTPISLWKKRAQLINILVMASWRFGVHRSKFLTPHRGHAGLRCAVKKNRGTQSTMDSGRQADHAYAHRYQYRPYGCR